MNIKEQAVFVFGWQLTNQVLNNREVAALNAIKYASEARFILGRMRALKTDVKAVQKMIYKSPDGVKQAVLYYWLGLNAKRVIKRIHEDT